MTTLYILLGVNKELTKGTIYRLGDSDLFDAKIVKSEVIESLWNVMIVVGGRNE